MSNFININGKLLPAEEAGISADSRAFRYGYGLIETMLVRDGSIRLAQLHWERLFAGMDLLHIHYPKYFRDELAREVQRTVQKNKGEAICRVRLQVYAGNGGFYDGDDFSARYVIQTYQLEADILKWNETGLIVGISDIIKHTGPYAHLKTCSALPYILAARKAKAAFWNDALLLNEHSRVTDSTIANIFWIKSGVIYTTPLSEGCVSGVMRRHLLETLPKLGYTVEEKPLYAKELSSQEGVFLCNVIRGLRWLKEVDAHVFEAENVQDLWQKLSHTLL